MNNLFLIEVMFYGKLLYLLIYIYIYNSGKPETVHRY